MPSNLQQLETFSTLEPASIMPQAIGARVPNLADYFGVWAVYPQVFTPMVERINSLDLRAHTSDPRSEAVAVSRNERRAFDMTADGVALIPISGPTMKAVGSAQAGTSTVRVRQQLAAARKDPTVRAAMLIMDTPGGTAKGNSDLANEVARFALAKPVHAFAEDMVASAGVSVASQAGRITANCSSCLYGAMGTFAVVVDSSERAAQLGVEVHVVKAGEFKGMGTPGTPVTKAQLDEMQRIVESLNESYLNLVARGRGMTPAPAAKLADGRIHPASEAQALGLIDEIGTFDAAYQTLLAAIDRPGARPATSQVFFNAEDDEDDEGADSPPDEDDAEEADKRPTDEDDAADDKESEKNMAAATLQELRDNFPSSTADWREEQQVAGNDLQTAAIQFANLQADENAKLRAAAEQPEDTPAPPASPLAIGHPPLTTASAAAADQGQSGNAVEDFNQAVTAICGANPNRERRTQAIRTVAARQPNLHAAYLLATNPGRKRQRQIIEKLEEQPAS